MQVVTGRIGEVLLHAQVPLGRLDRSMTERKLYMVELGAAPIGELGIGATQIVRRDSRAVRFNAPPAALRGQGLTRDVIALVHSMKHASAVDLRCGRPVIFTPTRCSVACMLPGYCGPLGEIDGTA